MSHRYALLAGFVPFVAGTLLAQAAPTSQPNLLNIIREIGKPNHSIAHAAVEARWADLERRANRPELSLALTSTSGQEEMWWISAKANFAEFGKLNDFGSDNAMFMQSLAKIQAEDAEHVNNVITMQARALPEASYGSFPDLSKVRVYQIETIQMKQGSEGAFAEISNHFKMAAGANAAPSGWRAYEVIAGAPGGTYLVFFSYPSWEAIDEAQKAMSTPSPASMPHIEAAMKLIKESVANTYTRYFTIEPRSSLVPKEWAVRDPFWKP